MIISDIRSNEEATQPVLYVLVGPPGSGKSTWRKKNTQMCAVLSTDDYIEHAAKHMGKTYSEVFDAEIKGATSSMMADLKNAVSSNRNIVWDQTNLSSNKRKDIVRKVPKHYRKVAVVFEVPRDVLEKRLEQRAKDTGKDIPMSVVDRLMSSYTAPTTSEGFDEVIFA